MGPTQPPRDRPAWLLAALAIIGTIVAGYLAWVAWLHHGLPLGCGPVGSCAEVLSSRWSTMFGIPVGLLAMPIYALVVWAALAPRSSLAGPILIFSGVVLALAAVWFLWLQAAVLRAFCPWCVGEHVLGLLVAALAVWRANRPATTLRRLTWWRGSAALGVISVVLLAILQRVQPTPASTLRLAESGSAATGSADSPVVLLQGHLQIIPAEEPQLGNPQARHRLYLMFDYCCPHCRRAHGYLLEAMQQYSPQLSLVCLPMPRDADCNPQVTETEARFEHACELAQLALAVWQAQPSEFAEFDRWLFEQQGPSPDVARAKAEQLVSAERLQRALDSDRGARQIARNVKAFNDSQVDYLPVMMAPGMNTIVGRPESRDSLLKVLETELLSSE